MAGRPNKAGLDYFDLDCHMDEKVRLIQAEFGLKGFAVVVKLFQKIYGENGYYCEWSEDSLLLFMSENGLSSDNKNLIAAIVAACIRRDIFSEQLFNKFSILTSGGIQKRYMNATSKREKVEMKKEYLLITVPENRRNVAVISISGGRNSISGGRNEQSRVEKSREENKRFSAAQTLHTTPEQMLSERRFPEKVESAVREWIKYKTEKRQGYKPTGLKSFLTQVENNVREYGDAEVSDLISYCMSQNWAGVTWDRLKEGRRQTRKENHAQKQNRFNNFPQRDYDFEQLEQQLIDC